MENERNSLVQMMQNHLVFFSFWRSLCAYIKLNTMMIFSNGPTANFTRKNYYHFFKNTKAKIEKGTIGEIKTREIYVSKRKRP